jgi:hypothetical protein
METNNTVLINKDSAVIQKTGSGYVDFELLPTVSAGIRLFNEHNFNVIMLDGEQIYDAQEEAGCILSGEKSLELTLGDVHISRIYRYNSVSADKCHNTLEENLLEQGINTAGSYFIGDSFKDMKIARRIGCSAVIVPSKLPELELLSNGRVYNKYIDFVSRDFVSASRWILANTLPMSDVSIIIPTRNEEHNLPLILPYLPRSAEIIVVDGHSNDNTVKIARALRPDGIILHQQGSGKGNALKMGFHHASREFIITFDADGSFQPTEVYKLIQKLREGYDLVKGSRFLPGGGTLDMPLNRIIGNWGLTLTANLLYGSRYSDLVYGFHAFRRNALKKLMLRSDGFEMDAELYLRVSRAKLRITELPSFENKRLYGTSNLNSIRDGSRILKTIIRERFRD